MRRTVDRAAGRALAAGVVAVLVVGGWSALDRRGGEGAEPPGGGVADARGGARARGAEGCSPGIAVGRVAYVRRGALHVLDLGTCRDRVLVRHGARPPVRWSADGRWIAYGSVAVVPSSGGPVRRPFGRPGPNGWAPWEWSSRGDRLAVATRGRGVLTWAPGEPVRRLLPKGWGLGGLAFDPSGERLAVAGPGQRLVVVDVDSGRRRLVHRVPRGKLAPQLVAGWSPDGRWILFWSDLWGSASAAADGLPLRAVPASGGRPVRVASPVLVYRDFLSRCGRAVVVAAGGDRYVNVGKRLVRAEPPDWRPRVLLDDPRRSYVWPACSPDGRAVVATSAPDRPIARFGVDRRSLWLVRADGSAAVRLTRARGVADEAPRWTADGRWVLFVRRHRGCRSPGRLFLLPVDPRLGRRGALLGPLATLGPGCGYYGHSRWPLLLDLAPPGPRGERRRAPAPG
jgi:hypothetical protein